MGAADWVWYACDLPTGRLITQLPLATSSVSMGLNMIGSGQFTLPIRDPDCPIEWEEATIPRRTVIVGEVNGRVVWSGIIWQRTRDDSDVVSLQCSTLESYYSRRYVDYTVGPYTDEDQATIALGLLHHAQHTVGIGSDTPYGVVYQVFYTGVTRDRTEYNRFADQKVYDMIQNLAQLEDGFEWLVEAQWHATDLPKRLSYIVRLQTNLGNLTPTPDWVFEHPGNIVSWALDEDFTEEGYANVVVAGGEGEEENRIMSTSGIGQDEDSLSFGNPLMEYRLQTQLTTVTGVNAAAKGLLARMKNGALPLSLTARDDIYTNSGQFKVGDTAIVRIRGGGFPDGYEDIWRVIAITSDPSSNTITPQLIPF